MLKLIQISAALFIAWVQCQHYIIPANDMGENFENINYKAFSNSWIVNLPPHHHLHEPDLVIAQLCHRDANCTFEDRDIMLVTCSELERILLHEGWVNENLMNVLGICDPLRVDLGTLQYAVNEVCVDRCASVVTPVGLEILNHHFISEYNSGLSSNYTTDPLHKYDIAPENHFITLQIRFVFLKRVLGMDAMTFSLRTTVLRATLTMPEQLSPVLGLKHECSARGFTTPAMATLDLFLEESGAYVCITDCRADFLRYPWNIEPPLSNNQVSKNQVSDNQVSDDQVTAETMLYDTDVPQIEEQCLQFPSEFIAILFSARLGLNVRAPFASYLPQQFYDDLNTIADTFAQKNHDSDIVVLNLPGSSFDNIKYETVVKNAIEFMDIENIHEIVRYDNDVSLNSISLPNRRRVLTTTESQRGSVLIEGLMITQQVSSQANTYVQQIEETWRLVTQSLPPTIVAVEGLMVQQVHRVATTKPTTDGGGGDSGFIRKVATASFEIIFVFIGCLLFGLVGLGARNNRSESRESRGERLK